MADINTVIVKIQAALTEAQAVPDQSAQITSLQNQLTALQAKYDAYTTAVRAAAQADKDQDDAREAGSGVLAIPV